MKNILLIVAICLITAKSYAQILTPVKWSYASKKINDKEVVLFLKASIEEGWHIYSLTLPPDGPQATTFSFQPNKGYQLNGKVNAAAPIMKHDPTFNMRLGLYKNSVIFQQKILLNDFPTAVKGTLKFMACNDSQCLPPEEVNFNIPVK